jgi:alpha-glucosidase
MHWTGDNKSTWDHLRLSVQMVLSLGLSGIALTGPDVGGFSGSPSPELYARWMQVGALLPFYRVHSMISSPDQEPWAFGPEVEAICRTYLELRYRLLHYIYTAAWQASQTGLPLARAMSLMYPDDPGTYNLDDQYLFGDSLLVAPVLDEGAARRGVYLPEGLWYDFWTGEKHSGRQVISATAPLGVLPLYVKGGAAIPLWPVQQYVGEKEIDLLTLHVYAAPGEHHSLLYEDDGVYVDHVALHAHRLSRFIVTDGRELSRVIERGSYAPPYDRLRIVYHGLESAPQSVDVNTGTLLSSAWDAETHRLTVDITAPGAFSIRLA